MEIQRIGTYEKAYVEILEIINHMGEEYKKKISPQLLRYFEENKDPNYIYQLDKNKSEGAQVFLMETIGLLSMLEYKYWAKDKEKEVLNNALMENEKKYQNHIRKKYDPNEIFTNKRTVITNIRDAVTENTDKNNKEMIEYKESIFNKIKKMLKNLIFFK